jgi:hypothetical protein
MTLKPGIITGMQFFGLLGDTLRVICKNAVSGAVYYDVTTSLSLYLSGDLMWEFYFGTARQQDSLRINGLYPQDAQVEITLTPSPTTGTAAIGIWALGSFQDIGLPQLGFKAKPVTYSYISIDKDTGEAVIEKGLSAKDLAGDCIMQSQTEAQQVADVITLLLGIPCAWVIVADTGFDYLTAFGLGSADITASGKTNARLSLTVQGLI